MKNAVFLRSVLQLLAIANVLLLSLLLFPLTMEAIHSSEMSVHIRAIRRQSQEDGILHSHRRENIKCYIALTGWTL
jgi:hypothetical protein